MAMKKLTLAAAISIGMFALGTGIASAESACPESLAPSSISAAGEATPMAESSEIIAQKQLSQTNAENQIVQAANSLPVVTGAACPCSPPVQYDSCEKPKTSCAVPACPVPASACCPGIDKKAGMFERQVYAYPSSIYGGNNAFNVAGQDMYFGEYNGLSVSSNKMPYLEGSMGAAAPLYPYSQGCGCTGGAAPLNSQYFEAYHPWNAQYQLGLTGAAAPMLNSIKQGCGCGPISIETGNSIPIVKKVAVPIQIPTGAAAPISSAFDDVPSGYWASNDINKLASSNIIAGYPDRTFRPNQTVTRAEFASMMVSGLDLTNAKVLGNQIFKDVPQHNWAKRSIDKVYVNGLMAGYSGDMFHPNNIISRAEALTTLAKSIPCEISACDADKILSQYTDANSVPSWAKIPVAKALKNNLLASFPNPTMISPDSETTRADAAAMLSQLRISLGLQKQEVAIPSCPTGAAVQLQEQTVNIPTIKLKFKDDITARASHTGDKIVGKTTESVTINGQVFPEGSTVVGKITEVIRPDSKSTGGLKIAFSDISNGKCKAVLPRGILCAQVQCDKKPNAIARFVQWPFVWTGRVLGDAGRTVGSAVVVTGNAVEQVTNDVGIAAGDVFQGQFMASGRALKNGTVALFRAPVDVVRIALSGTAGALMVTGDEIGYLVNPDGKRIAEIHPNETVQIAFGCQ